MANFLDANDYLESHYLAKNPFWKAIIWQKYLWQAVFLARSKFYVIQNQWNHLEIQSFQGTKTKWSSKMYIDTAQPNQSSKSKFQICLVFQSSLIM